VSGEQPEQGAGSRDLESKERGFLILIILISYYRGQGDLLPWIIRLLEEISITVVE
jgi:hypothetical protein